MSKIKDYYLDREPKGFEEYLSNLQPVITKEEWDFCKQEKLRAEAEDREKDLAEGWEPNY